MAECTSYDIPSLELDEIVACLHEGVLGQRATNLTAEHLKNPTRAGMMQICYSILEKALKIDADALNHPQPEASAEFQYPEFYTNTAKLIDVTVLMKKALPAYGGVEFQLTLTDITSPRRRRVRKLLDAAINYFKSWDMNVPSFERIYSETAQLNAEHKKLLEEIATCEAEVKDLQAFSQGHESRKQELKEKREQLDRRMTECHKLKEEKVLIKANLKQKFQNVAAAMDQKLNHIKGLEAEKEKLRYQVVKSPQKFLAEKQSLDKKTKVVEELHAEWQGKLHEAERMNNATRSMEQLLSDVLKTLKDNKSMSEDMTNIDSENQAKIRENENLKLAIVGNTQEITNLKHQVASLREKMSRRTVRWKQISSEYQSTIDALTRQKAAVESKSGEVNLDVIKKQARIKTLNTQLEEIEQRHRQEMNELQGKQKQLMQAMDNFVKQMMEKLHNDDAMLALLN